MIITKVYELKSCQVYVMFAIFTIGVHTTSGLMTCDTTASDVDLSACAKNILLELQPSLGPGITSLGIPPMDPFGFGGLSVAGGSSLVNFVANVSNVVVRGFSNFTNLGIQFNTIAHTAMFTLTLPHIRADGHYTANGNLIPLLGGILPISGEGAFWFDFVGIQLPGSFRMRNRTDGSTTFLEIYDVILDGSILDYSFEFTNFGGSMLGPTINFLPNLGKPLIFQQLKPSLDQKTAELVPLTINPFLQNQAYNRNI